MDLGVLRCSRARHDVFRRDVAPRLVSFRPFRRRLQARLPFERPSLLRSNPLERVSSAVQNENQLESTKLPSELRQKVETVVEDQGNRVTVGDVSGAAGVTLGEAEDALKALAADSLGTLEVSSEGEVVYVFPRDFKNQIRSKSWYLRMEPRLKAAAAAAGWLGRVSFGVFFVGSVIAVWVAILVIMASSDKDDNRSSGRSSRSGSMAWINLFDTVRFFSYMNYARPYDERADYDRRGGMNFMEAVFSFMFGDGDPNAEFEDLRWNTIGNYIRANGGVVVAEELAPFLDVAADASDEGYVLPALTRFEGEPLVNDRGELVYVFPKLQSTGISWLQRREDSTVSYVKEEPWKFSRAGGGQLALVVFFAVANIVGVNILSGLAAEQLVVSAAVAPAVPIFFGVLQVYAWSFVLVPLMRLFSNWTKNRAIKARNDQRAKNARKISLLPAALRAKIDSARRMKKRRFVGQRDIVYSSAKEMDDQSWEEEDFDRRLREVGN